MKNTHRWQRYDTDKSEATGETHYKYQCKCGCVKVATFRGHRLVKERLYGPLGGNRPKGKPCKIFGSIKSKRETKGIVVDGETFMDIANAAGTKRLEARAKIIAHYNGQPPYSERELQDAGRIWRENMIKRAS